MKKNKGFSLIELIVTISIMAIFSAGVVTIVISQSDYYSKKAAEYISTALSETRAQALAKSDAWMEIRFDADDGYVIETSYSGRQILGTRCQITYESGVSGSGTLYAITDTSPLIISYNRGSGAFRYRITAVSTSQSDVNTRMVNYTYAGTEYCTKIIVSNGSTDYELTLYPETGKHDCVKK